MRIRRGVAAFAGCAAVLAAGVPPAAGSPADPEPRTCSSVLRTTGPVEIREEDEWTYVYTLSWCVEEGKIVWAAHEVAHVVHVPGCTWVGRKEEKITEGVSAWNAFDMSEFSCADGDGEVRGVNPWVDVNFSPDGTFEVENDVAR